MKKKYSFLCFIFLLASIKVDAQNFITTKNKSGAFAVVSAKRSAVICVDSNDYFLINKAAHFLQQDIKKVTARKPEIFHAFSGNNAIIIGSVNKSSLIKKLIADRKLDTTGFSGKWESYKIKVVDHPEGGIDKALVVMGSDRRGTAYGVFTISRQMGVSPWYWWADVPVKKKKEVFVKKGTYFFGPPAVKYRGIFLNDEAPALSGWVYEKFGGFNHKFYVKVFELLLRLKGNYLWPAMWGNSFNVDDTLNPVLADKYGMVMGTAHNEPMMRSRKEWRDFGQGDWNYQTNADTLKAFWKKGIQRMDDRESIVTIGMRGNGDKPMSDKTNIALLEKIVQDQRKIIEEVTGKPASETPQDWALYKEVQEYYDKGMRVPDDVTLLYCDDNWGNIRRLPGLKDSSRQGGFGLYYHFDYVGGPRNYKWLNTNQISRVWEQLHLAYEYHIRQIWIVNVGDLKPMELPISFFLDYAWNPDEWNAKDMASYTKHWAAEQFGDQYADSIAYLLEKYTQYNSRRKPELLSPETYSLAHYREAEKVVNSYYALKKKAEKIEQALPKNYKSAFYQLVLYPVAACANLNNLYVTAAKNHLYARQGRALTNEMSDSVKSLFIKDSLLSHYYNKVLANGKWDHFMDQTHIGYTYWQQPEHNNMPDVKYIHLPEEGNMGIAIQGTNDWWPQAKTKAILPTFDPYNQQQYYIDIFNRGKTSFNYQAKAGKPWIKISQPEGKIDLQKRIWISIDWKNVPKGKSHSFITITRGNKQQIEVLININNVLLSPMKEGSRRTFIESNGYISMEAAHYNKAVHAKYIHWVNIPGLGRTLSGMTAFPVTAKSQQPGTSYLEYSFYLFDTGMAKVHVYLSPTLDIHHSSGLRYGLSIDNKPVQIVNMNIDKSDKIWRKAVSNNIKIMTTPFNMTTPGWHTLKFHLIDPGIVLQKMVIDMGGEENSYLGPPESYRLK